MGNFDINRYFKIFWNSKLYIVFILLLCLAIGYFYSYYYVTPMYQSSATVVLVQNENLEQELAGDSSITQTDITLNKNLLSTYTKIAKSNTVLEKVISDLNLDMTPSSLASLVNVQAVNNTQVFKISVSNKDRELAPKITNHLLEVFSEEVHSLYHMNNIYTMDQAEVASMPYNIHHTKDLVVFFMIGLVLSFGLVIAIYLLDTTIKSEKDIEDYANLSVLSTIPMYVSKLGKQENELIVNEEPKSPISECFKTFRTNVMFSIQNKKLNTILVTSGYMGEGKSFVSSNLAVAFASSGRKVILVDTDMRKGRLHKIFGVSNEQGLSTCLAKIGTDGNLVNINEFIKESHIANLHVMTSGIVPPNPSELLSSSNMVRLLEALNRQYDVVICDGTPCMLVSDSIILSKIVDTTVVVTANRTTKLDTLLKIKKSIEMVGGTIGGTVINKMEINQKSYKNSYYYGEHKKQQTADFTVPFVHDTVLDTPLFVRELEEVLENDVPLESTVSFEEEIANSHSNKELMALSNTIYENTKQILELKDLYKDVMQVSAPIIEELQNFKINYEHNMEKQSEEMNVLSKKLENIQNNDSSNSILDRLDDLHDEYRLLMRAQSNEINTLNEKLASNNGSDKILNRMEVMEKNYQNLLQLQEEKINKLNQKINDFQANEELTHSQNEITQIYHQLKFINRKFESLEERANHNEILIQNLLKEVKNSLYQPSRTLDINQLNHKVIQIQDYLEKSTQVVDEVETSSIGKKHKNVLEGQLNMIDDLLSNISPKAKLEIDSKPEVEPEVKFEEVLESNVKVKEEVESDINLNAKVEPNVNPKLEVEPVKRLNTYVSVVDYEAVKRKQERKGFSFFKTKNKNIIEEEPITIVSQILSNRNESVG